MMIIRVMMTMILRGSNAYDNLRMSYHPLIVISGPKVVSIDCTREALKRAITLMIGGPPSLSPIHLGIKLI